jgi:uroporphyrinogen decarboxylase
MGQTTQKLARRTLFGMLAGIPIAAQTSLTSRERVDRALTGREVDRPPLSLWHHFGLEKQGPRAHADATIRFHRSYGTDLVKVMSDFAYPKPARAWELREEKSPFPQQLEALAIIQRNLDGKAHFIETIFNPWNVAEKLSSPADVRRLKTEQPQKLLDALGVIARSEANHARLAAEAGASGIFLAIANADAAVMTREDYEKFSAPFDRMVLDAVKGSRLNILHLHGNKIHFASFLSGWPAAAINYSTKGTGVPLADMRTKYGGVLMGGIDEVDYRTATVDGLREQARSARQQAGTKFILSPGCSVPNEATPAELGRLRAVFG